ncbi:MAG TPA: ShlB/FhaC/HecB family hemolysin secretion/activation protein [Ferruginibacter sp.]|nr:ShlB/FhaC/HecB family hemolysin secretion/activation protein [Ferruginibacter sp.]
MGLKYARLSHRWRKYPFSSEHGIEGRYSLTEKGFSANYEGDFTSLIRKWNLSLLANYDQVRWYNYFGLGNESIRPAKDRTPFRLRTKEIMASAGLNRRFGKYHRIGLAGFYQVVQVKNDSIFTKSLLPAEEDLYNKHHFAGAQFIYSLQAINDSLLPTKGFGFTAVATYTDNLKNDNNFMRYSGLVQLYFPFTKTIGLAIRTGASTLSGTPEFYQYNSIGGGSSLRGFNRTRFFGKTAVFDQNEIRWVKNARSYLYNGKFGLLAFYDIGRVWMPGEKSTTWHSGYGGGLILAPYNRISVSAGYGVSKEGGVLFFRLLRVI